MNISKHAILRLIQRTLAVLAVVASALLVVEFIAPELGIWLLKPFAPQIQSLPEIESNIITYLLIHLFVIGFLLLFLKLFGAKIADLGVGKMKQWWLILMVPLIFVAYMIVTIALSQIVALLFPGFNIEEQQDIGLSKDGSPNLLLTGLFLCLLVPLAEEFIFRGYIFGVMRKYAPFIVTAIITSIIFAIMHIAFDTVNGQLALKQLNVAVDVFVLSLFLCYLREKTNSIWAGVALHGLKNFIAFLMLFVYNLS